MEHEDEFKALRIQFLIKKHLEQDLAGSEEKELQEWLDKDEKNQQLLSELSKDVYLERALIDIGKFDSNAALRKLQAKMDRGVPVIGKRANVRRIYLKVAAAAILILGSGIFLLQRRFVQTQFVTISVPYGKLRQITLSDSTKVWLNAGTTIRYPEKFNGNTRNVSIKNGQAFFNVVHDPNKPFVVDIDGIDVTVLGTSFEVKAFADEKEDKVTVSSGKVGISPKDSKQSATMLLPDEQAVFNKASKQIKTRKINAADIATWRENKLVFENENFQDVIHALERKYNVRISIENKNLLELKITLRLDNQPLTNVLSVLGFSNNFTYTKKNEQLIVIR